MIIPATLPAPATPAPATPATPTDSAPATPAPGTVISQTRATRKVARVNAPATPLAEPTHRAYALPNDGGKTVVVAIEQIDSGNVEQHMFLGVNAWEVDASGAPTGNYAAIGTHSIPHALLQDQATITQMVDELTNAMLLRVLMRETALAAPDGLPIKKLPARVLKRPPQFPYPLLTDDPTPIA